MHSEELEDSSVTVVLHFGDSVLPFLSHLCGKVKVMYGLFSATLPDDLLPAVH